MLMPSARQTKRIMEKSSMLVGIYTVFGLALGDSTGMSLGVLGMTTLSVGSLK